MPAERERHGANVDGGPHQPEDQSSASDPGDATVAVSDRQRRRLGAAQVQALATLARETLLAGGELSLSFVDPDEMEDLHVRYMDEPGPTDVLSFPLGEDGLLGDVIVCPSVAAANNPEDPEGELRLLVVHGVLHVLGYDHHDDSGREDMWSRQERYSGMRVP